MTFKTAYELDQRWIIEHASDRTSYICQSQSVNLFLPANVHKRYLHKIHMLAWKKGLKSLYYCRSQSMQRADKVSHDIFKKVKYCNKKQILTTMNVCHANSGLTQKSREKVKQMGK